MEIPQINLTNQPHINTKTMTKKLIILTLVSVMTFACQTKNTETPVEHQHEMPMTDTSQAKAKSPLTAAMANVGDNHVHISYSAPSVRGRLIFGGLVAFGEVWATGAHNATNINFDKDVIIEGKNIKAGKYALFTMPGQDKWTIIINRNWDQHLADEYDPKDDVIRWQVTPTKLTENVEQLTFEVKAINENEGQITFKWSDISFDFNFKNL